MTPKERAREIARLLNAWADGQELEVFRCGIWQKPKENPCITRSNLHTWRIKQHRPRTRWVVESSGLSSCDPSFADFWRKAGETVTEWQEVVK